MEKQTWIIIILSNILTISILLNIAYSYTVTNINTEWESDFNYMNVKWCELLNEENQVINDFISDLAYYDEYYEDMPYMDMMNCSDL